MPDLIEDFVDTTRNLVSPERFRRWAGVSLISTLLGRKVTTSIRDGRLLYPNTYVVLVSPPGIGKSEPMEIVRDLLVPYYSIKFAPDEITPQKMIMDLGEKFAPGLYMDGTHNHVYLALISELGTFMPKPDVQFIQALARIWDCSSTYSRGTKHQGEDDLEYHYVNILAGAQPAWFAEGFPPNAYEMGLPARLFLIFSDEHVDTPYFKKIKRTSRDTVIRKLKMIARMRGFMAFTEEAQDRWNEWARTDCLPDRWDPPLDDPMLKGFGVRRNMHAGKLAMIVAAARHPNKMEIGVTDVEHALELLFEAETLMPRAVSGAGGNIYRLREESIIGFIAERCQTTGKTVPEWQVRQRMSRVVPPVLINGILDGLIANRTIQAMGGKTPNRRFRPYKESEDGKEKT